MVEKSFKHNSQQTAHSLSKSYVPVSVNTLKRSNAEKSSSMPLLKRKITETSFIITIESGVEEIQDGTYTPSANEECDFLVNFITGEESLSATFCCKLFYTLFRICFVNEEGAGGRLLAANRRSTYHTI